MTTASPAGATGRSSWLSSSPYRRRSGRANDLTVMTSGVPSGRRMSYQDVGPSGAHSPYTPGTLSAMTPHTPGTPGTHASAITHHTTLLVDDSDEDTGCCFPHKSSRARRERSIRTPTIPSGPHSPEGIPYKFYNPTLQQQQANLSPVSSSDASSPVTGSGGRPVSMSRNPIGFGGTEGSVGVPNRNRASSVSMYGQGKGAPLTSTGHPKERPGEGPAVVVVKQRQSQLIMPAATRPKQSGLVDDDGLW